MYLFISTSSCLCTPLAPIFISHMTSLNSLMSILNYMSLWHINFKRAEKVSGKWPKGKCIPYDCAKAVAILISIIVVFSRDFLRRLCEKDMGQQVWKRVREMKVREKVKGKRDMGEREMESFSALSGWNNWHFMWKDTGSLFTLIALILTPCIRAVHPCPSQLIRV